MTKTGLLNELKAQQISKRQDDYKQLIDTVDSDNAREIFETIISNNDSDEVLTGLLILFIKKLTTNIKDGDILLSSLVSHILLVARRISMPAPILLTLLENINLKKDSDSLLRILEALKKTEFTVISVINMMYKPETANIVYEILNCNERLVEEFLREAINYDDINVIKNLSVVLPLLDIKHFVNYKQFLILFEMENYLLRNALVDIIEMLILYFKDESNIEAIKELTELLEERLCDVNFYVRGKVLGCIADLFRKECILKDQRNSLMRAIIERISDKTVVVRKKAISILSQILLNHPFKNKESLSRTEHYKSRQYEGIDEEIGSSENKVNTQKPKHDVIGRIDADFVEFAELIEIALNSINSLLVYNLKTDLQEICIFAKIAYLLQVDGSGETIDKLLGLIYTKDKDMIIEMVRDIVEKQENSIYEFISNRAFEDVLRYLEIDDKMLYKNFYNGYKPLETSFILRHLRKKISENNGLILLSHTTEILFKSKSEEDLEINIKIYNNVLCILKGIRNRIVDNDELLKIINKNLMKMLFFDSSSIRFSVELFYHISLNPEKNCQKMLKNLCLTKSTIKILDSIGWIALNHFHMLERLEKKYKAMVNANVKDIAGENYDKFRKSIDKYDNLDELRTRRKSIEEGRRKSIEPDRRGSLKMADYSRVSLKFDDLQESMKTKSEEEIADFFFFLKDRELLFSSTSILHQFLPLLNDSLKSSNEQVRTVAYSSLNKLMLISSAFFNENYHLFLESLKSESAAIKNNALIALHDFIIFYNTLVDSALLFDMLFDPQSKKNAILIIYSLMHKNIIRINNNSTKLVCNLFDPEIGSIIKTLLSTFSNNNNITSVIFYETFLSDLSIDYLKTLCTFVSPNIHESLFLKCIKTSPSMERLKIVYENFTIGDKFKQEHAFMDEIRILVSGTN